MAAAIPPGLEQRIDQEILAFTSKINEYRTLNNLAYAFTFEKCKLEHIFQITLKVSRLGRRRFNIKFFVSDGSGLFDLTSTLSSLADKWCTPDSDTEWFTSGIDTCTDSD